MINVSETLGVSDSAGTDAVEIIAQSNLAVDQLVREVIILLFQTKIHLSQSLVFMLSTSQHHHQHRHYHLMAMLTPPLR